MTLSDRKAYERNSKDERSDGEFHTCLHLQSFKGGEPDGYGLFAISSLVAAHLIAVLVSAIRKDAPSHDNLVLGLLGHV